MIEGLQISENTLKSGIQELNSSVHFDVGGRMNINHPMIGNWQGVWFGPKHICAMDRQTEECMVPEWPVVALVNEWDEAQARIVKAPGRVIRTGWRWLFDNLTKARISGISHETLCEKFGVPLVRDHRKGGIVTGLDKENHAINSRVVGAI